MEIIKALEIVSKCMGDYDFTGYGGVVTHTKDSNGGHMAEYHKSLDKLEPVWRKAKIINYYTFEFETLGDNYHFHIIGDRDRVLGEEYHGKASTLQEAALIATAKTIEKIIDNT